MSVDYDEKPSTRVRILYEGAKLTGGVRDSAYGEPVGNMQDIAAMWSTYLIGKHRGDLLDENGFKLSGEDVAHMMSLMKIVRTYAPALTPDNYIDGATYGAIAGECAERERNNADDT